MIDFAVTGRIFGVLRVFLHVQHQSKWFRIQGYGYSFFVFVILFPKLKQLLIGLRIQNIYATLNAETKVQSLFVGVCVKVRKELGEVSKDFALASDKTDFQISLISFCT